MQASGSQQRQHGAVTGTQTGAALVLLSGSPWIGMRPMVMHGRRHRVPGLHRHVSGGRVVFRAMVQPHSVRELDAEQQHHLEKRDGGRDEQVAQTPHGANDMDPPPLRQPGRTIFGPLPRVHFRSYRKRTE